MFELRAVQPRIKFLSAEKEVSENLSTSVIGFQVQKHLDQAAGAFELTLVPRAHDGSFLTDSKALSYIYRNVMPMDLISIGVESDGGIMVGIVDNVYKSRSNLNEQVGRSIMVRGRDFGKILVEDNTFVTPSSDDAYIEKLRGKLLEKNIVDGMRGEDVNEHPIVNFYTENLAPAWKDKFGNGIGRTYIGKTIEEAVEYVLKSLSSLRLKITFDGRKDISAHELLTYMVSSRDGDQIAISGFTNYVGSIINLLYAFIDRDFYELFIETYLEQPALVIRPKPFDRVGDMVTNEDNELKALDNNAPFLWDNLKTILDKKPYHEIPERDIVQLNMGVADYEAYSVYVHNARQTLVGVAYEQAGMFWPLHDFFAIQRYGLKLKKTITNLVPLELEKDEKTVKDKEEKDSRIMGHRDRLFNWNRFNPILESGQVVVRGHDYYKLGDKVFLKDELAQNGELGITAYTQGYAQTWSYGGAFLTRLNLIRGENEVLIEKFKKLTKDDVVRAG